jgi:predicted SprT family Zn-dependent metalloprotease
MNIEQEYTKLIHECEKMVMDLKFPLPEIIYRINNRLRVSYGRTKFGEPFVIELNGTFLRLALENDMRDEIKDTLLHEICHTLPNGFNHSSGFANWTNRINKKYNMSIGTHKSSKTMVEIMSNELVKTKLYVKIKCEKCGLVSHCSTRTSKILHEYKCIKCGGNLQKIVDNLEQV